MFRVNCLVDGTVYIRTVRLFKLCTFDSLLAGLGRNIVYSACCSALTSHKLVEQNRQQALRDY